VDTGYAKSSVHEDLMVHVLHAIIEGLDEHLRWPEDNHRHKLATVFTATFSGRFGVGDVKEYHIKKPKFCTGEKVVEWGDNRYKLLRVVDHTG
jgi:hypothetical protein